MELLNRFVQVRRDFLEIVSIFPEEKTEEAVCGDWDIKCVLAHIVGWDTYFTTIVRLLRVGEEVPYRGDRIEKWNERFAKEQEGRTWSQVRCEFVRAGEEFIEEYSTLKGELWNRCFWRQRQPTPSWVVRHNTNHYEGHMKGIEKKLEEWKG